MLIRVALLSALGGFLYGYDMGLIGGALVDIRQEFHTSEGQDELVVGATKVGAVFGTFLGGGLMVHYGRRVAIAIDSVFFMLGPLTMAASSNVAGLVVGRLLVGFGIGASAVVVPAYLGEIAPAAMRGRIVEVYEVLLCLGMLMAVLADWGLQRVAGGWRWMVGLPFLPALVLSAALVLLPESPRWLVVQGRLDEALAIIHRVLTNARLPQGAQGSTAEVEDELLALWSSVEKDKAAARERAAVAVGPVRRSRGRAGGVGAGVSAMQQWNAGRGGGNGRWQQLQEDGVPPEGVGSPATKRATVELLRAQPGTAAVSGAALGQVPAGSTVRGDRHAAGVGNVSLLATEGELPQARAGDVLPQQWLSTAADPTHDAGGDAPAARRGGSIAGGDDSSPRALQRALSDPQSPLFCALASVPKGLAPVRTRSNPEDLTTDSETGSARPAAHCNTAASKQGGACPRPSALPTPAAAGFWRTQVAVLVDVWRVLRGPERRAVRLALVIAFIDQAMASTAVVNYAPELLMRAGLPISEATLWTSAIAGAKIVGVGLTMLLVDSAGRRPLMLWGSTACMAALLLLAAGDWRGSPMLMLAAMCLFLLAFSASYAGLFWILCSELFSMQAKAPAASAATAMLFAGGAAADLAFLSIHSALGAGTFLVFAAVAGAGGVYCWAALPETKGRSLAEVQALLAVDKQPLAAADDLASRGGVGGSNDECVDGQAASYPALLAAGADAEAGRAFGTAAGKGVQRRGWLRRLRSVWTSS